MSVLVEYEYRDTLFHKLNPLSKIIWTFAILILCFITDNPIIILALFVSDLLIAACSKVLKQILPVAKGLIIFALFLTLFQIFFVSEGKTVFYIIPYFKAGRITDYGLKLSTVMALRMLASVTAIPLLLLTTRITDIVVVMVEKLRVPFKYAFMFTTVIRFIPFFVGELNQIMQAQMSRGYHSDTKNPFKKIIVIVPLAIPLLVSSVKKAERMAISMEARGFGSGTRSHFRTIRMSPSDYVFICFLSVIIICSFILVLL